MLNLRFWRNSAFLSTTASRPASGSAQPRPSSLAQARNGAIVRISGFGQLNATQRQHLQAYGLMPGRTVQVLAQKPVTIVLVEQTELAFETEISLEIQVS